MSQGTEMHIYLKKHVRHISTFVLLSIVLLSAFINCSKYSSNMDQSSIQENSIYPNTNGATPGTVKQSLVLTCLPRASSTAAKNQKMTIAQKAQKISSQIRDFSWDQTEDLIVTLNSACLRNNKMTDSLLKYIALNKLNLDLDKSVYVIDKNSVTDLQQFNLDALNSVCMEAADINKPMKLSISDPYFSSQTFYSSIGLTESLMNTILSYNSGSLYTTKVAVVDSGVDTNHPDLTNQIAKNSGSQVIGVNAANGSTDYSDFGFHGTHVTGLIAASYNNSSHGIGAYGKNIKIYPARVFDTTDSAPMSVVANAILWAANQDVDLINLSMGGPAESVVLKNAIQTAVDKGVFVIVAAGNDAKSLDSASKTYPAVYSSDIDGLITVGSFDASSLGLSSFSNYSPNHVDILSPGSNGTLGILSTVPTSKSASGMANKINTSPIHGTSMATPVVTGVMAAMISTAKAKGFRVTPSQLERFVHNEGTPSNSSYNSYSKGGKYLSYTHMYSALLNQIDSTQKIIEFQNQPKIQKAIVGDKIQFTTALTSNSNYIVNYQWYKNNVKLTGETQANLILNSITTSDAGEYQLEISSGTKKVLSQKVTLTVGLKYCD
jgi:subtilisin family serine protease